MYRTADLFEDGHSLLASYILSFDYPWQALEGLSDMIIKLAGSLPPEYRKCGENVWIHETARVFPSASISGPCIIGRESEVRHCAFIRTAALIGDGCVIGNSVELKNVIISDSVQVPHYNYVGDSILGYRSHMGAGSLTSNVKSDRTPVIIRDRDGNEIRTGRKKVGAFLGDRVEVGCNSVLCPGTVIGRDSIIYPLSRVRGVVPERSIFKSEDDIVVREERNA